MTLLIFCSKPGNPREGGSRAKPGNQLVSYITKSACFCVTHIGINYN